MKESVKIEKPADPVLEARKRKFESNEIKIKEGVIRLKPKTEETNEKQEENVQEEKELNEEEEDNLLDMHVDDLFSDEETDDENEGRFKTNSQQSQKTTVLPFTRLLKGSSTTVKDVGLLPDQKRTRDNRDRRRRPPRTRRSPLSHASDRNRRETNKIKPVDSKRYGGVPPERKITKNPPPIKNRIVTKSDKPKVVPIINTGEKKIEIKIRNPAKYEQSVKKSVESEEPKEKVARKVEVDVLEEKESEFDDQEPEIIIDNEEDDEDVFAGSDGKFCKIGLMICLNNIQGIEKFGY